MELKEKIAVMQAFADGKEIEWRPRILRGGHSSFTWEIARLPYGKLGWNWEEYEYRIKKTPITIDVVVYQFNKGPVKACHKTAYGGFSGSESWLYHKLYETTIILPEHIEPLK